MRTICLAISLAVFAAACVTDTALDDRPAHLTSAERDPFVARIRAQFAARNIVPIPSRPAVDGGGKRFDKLAKLGQALMFDKILSDNQDISCMTCHPAAAGGDDDRHLSDGVRGLGLGPARAGGTVIPRNAPPLWNLHAIDSLFWDGRVERLPDGSFRTPAGAQLTPEMLAVFEFGAVSAIGLFPVTNRDEMREHVLDGRFDDLTTIPDGDFTAIWDALMDRLRAIPEYRRLFGEAYPDWPGERDARIDTMTFAHASNAMAAFMIKHFTAADSPWDKFVGGKHDAFKELEDKTEDTPTPILEIDVLRGAEKFLATCANCHNGPLLSDNRFHNTALAQFGPGQGDGGGLDDFGRARVTDDEDARCGNPGSGASCRYAFRTTPLRNVVFTAPFGHAGEIGRFGNAATFDEDLAADLEELRAFVAHYAVSPADNLRTYDVTQIAPGLQGSLLANTEDIIAHIDPLFAGGSPIVPEDVDILTAFMFAQTQLSLFEMARHQGSALGLARCPAIPSSVPSGLSIDADRATCDGHN